MDTFIYISLALLGVVLFAVAGLFAARFWERYFRATAEPERRKACVLLMITILPLLGGGFLSTYYWNAYFRAEEMLQQRDAMIHILAAELVVNMSIYQDQKFREPDDENLSTLVVFPTFQTSALKASIASCLFIAEDDREFLTVLFDVTENLTSFNARISYTQEQMLRNPRAENIALWRKKMRDGKTLQSVRPRLDKLAHLLISEYGVSEDEVFFEEVDY